MGKAARQVVEEALRSPEGIKLLDWGAITRQRPGYRRIELTAKSWLLPDGQFVALGGEQHEAWLQAHGAIAERFGLIAAQLRRDRQCIRMAAVRHGFFRVAYQRSSGRLVLEGMDRFCQGEVKTQLFMLIADNARAIHRITFKLFDDRGGVLVSQSINLVDCDDDEKLERIPVLSETLRYRLIARRHFR